MYVLRTTVILILIALIIGAGAFLWHTISPQDARPGTITQSLPEIRAVRGTVNEVAEDSFSFMPEKQYSNAVTLRTVVLASSTLIREKGTPKPKQEYEAELAAYQEQMALMSAGDADARSYLETHPFPDEYEYASVGLEALQPGQTVLVLSDTDMRHLSRFTAEQVDIEGTRVYSDTLATAKDDGFFGVAASSLGRLSAAVYGSGFSTVSGWHQGELHQVGDSFSNQFYCESGYDMVFYHYEEGNTTNNANWYACVAPNIEANQEPTGTLNLISSCTATGWTEDPNTPGSAIQVHFHIDGAYAGAVVANQGGGNVFSYSIPQLYRDGASHQIYAYGIDSTTGNGTNLGGSPQTFQCAAANSAPGAPSISGPTSGTPGGSYSFTFSATDPDGSAIRYGVDWDNLGDVDVWLPASGYVGSGTGQSYSWSWASAGTYTFRARTEDSSGLTSGYTYHTITISQAPPPTSGCSITLTASPSTISSGGISTLRWSTTGVAQGPWATFNNGNAVGTQNQSGWNVQPSSSTVYGMSAFGSDGSQCDGTATVYVNSSPPPQQCTPP